MFGLVRWQAANMGENIAKLIDSHFSESIDMSEEQVKLSLILSFGLHLCFSCYLQGLFIAG